MLVQKKIQPAIVNLAKITDTIVQVSYDSLVVQKVCLPSDHLIICTAIWPGLNQNYATQRACFKMEILNFSIK